MPKLSEILDKVTKRYIKNIDTDVLFVGFPQSSLDKFKVEGSTVEPPTRKILISKQSLKTGGRQFLLQALPGRK